MPQDTWVLQLINKFIRIFFSQILKQTDLKYWPIHSLRHSTDLGLVKYLFYQAFLRLIFCRRSILECRLGGMSWKGDLFKISLQVCV